MVHAVAHSEEARSSLPAVEYAAKAGVPQADAWRSVNRARLNTQRPRIVARSQNGMEIPPAAARWD